MALSPPLFDCLAVVIGLILGSFFNVLIWRLPREEEVVLTPSHCPACGRRIKPWENIPLLSYLLLRGRCSGCRGRISPVYPIIEALTACLTLLLWRALLLPDLLAGADAWHWLWRAGQAATLLLLVPIAVIDLRHFIIPNVLTVPGTALGVLLALLPGDVTWWQSLLGLAAGGGTLYVFGALGELVLRKESMGFGDVKLMAWVGALFGWQTALLAILLGSFAGALGGGLLLLGGRLRPDHHIPFGPFLGAGILAAVLWGGPLTSWYLGLSVKLFLP